MFPDHSNDKVQEIKRNLIRTQVLYENAKRSAGGLSGYLRKTGCPEEIITRIEKQDAAFLELSYRRNRDLCLFELALLSGTREDFDAFARAFMNIPTAT